MNQVKFIYIPNIEDDPNCFYMLKLPSSSCKSNFDKYPTDFFNNICQQDEILLYVSGTTYCKFAIKK